MARLHLPAPAMRAPGPRPRAPAPRIPRSALPPRPRRGAPARAREDTDPDVAVFRFTLGIPGVDDAIVPRIVGWVALAALAANRWFSQGAASPGQTVAESVAAALAAACVALPSLETALLDAAPGRGRRAAGAVAGSASLFRVARPPALADAAAAELAWASYALLRNANVCSVAVVALPDTKKKGARPPAALLLRGALPAALASAADPLVAASAAVAAAVAPGGGGGGALARVAAGESGGPVYLPDSTDGGWGLLPAGAGCALIQPVPRRGGGAPPAALLVVAGERAGALTARDRAWVAALAAKLGGVLG